MKKKESQPTPEVENGGGLAIVIFILFASLFAAVIIITTNERQEEQKEVVLESYPDVEERIFLTDEIDSEKSWTGPFEFQKAFLVLKGEFTNQFIRIEISTENGVCIFSDDYHLLGQKGIMDLSKHISESGEYILDVFYTKENVRARKELAICESTCSLVEFY